MKTVRSFVDNYTASDAASIAFAWNGQHGQAFVDSNLSFRKQVLAEVLLSPESASGDLIRDLFIAETEFAKQAWVVDMRVAKLAEILLSEAAAEPIAVYLRGSHGSMDTYLTCASAHFTDEQLRRFAQLCAQQASACTTDADRAFWTSGQEMFTGRIGG